ncbi:MAG TPA: MOFRL family protein, partial [Kofleriaceae bacterium]
ADICLAPIRTLIVSDVIGDPPGIIGSGPTFPERAPDTLEVVMPMKSAFDAWCWTQRTSETFRMFYPLEGEIDRVAEQLLSAEVRRVLGGGEPTLRVPERHGTGGRAQHLALLLARGLRDTQRSAFVVGTDGIDGPPRRGLDAPAGAYVDGRTWNRIRGAGIDPERALEQRDSTMALAAAGALVVTGPTGINHGDLVVIG